MKIRFKLIFPIFITSLLFSFRLAAQDGVNDLIKGSTADATKLVGAYLNPAFKGLGVGLNSGWSSAAKTAGFLRFDVRVTTAYAEVPKNEQTFDVLDLKLETLTPADPNKTITPTLFGGDEIGVVLQQKDGTAKQITLPNGLDINYVPAGQLQFTLGVMDNMDISLRYLQTPNFDEFGRFKMVGAGAKVEILPLLLGKAGKMLPFEISLGGGFTQLNYEKSLDVNNGAYNDQQLAIIINGYNIEAIVSKKLSILTPFASVGYQNSNHKANILGTYEINGSITKDPIRINESTLNNLKATAGFQLKLLAFKFYAAYSLSSYNYLNVGIGLGTSK